MSASAAQASAAPRPQGVGSRMEGPFVGGTKEMVI